MSQEELYPGLLSVCSHWSLWVCRTVLSVPQREDDTSDNSLLEEEEEEQQEEVEEEEEEDDEENDVSTLSGLDNHEICIKYQQVTPNLAT